VPDTAQQLKRERERRGWSQADVAEKIGTTAPNVSRWEHGITSPGPYFRQKLCQLFEKTVEELGLLQENSTGKPEELIDKSYEQREQEIPLLWSVPYHRNPFFTGRDSILERLHVALHTEKAADLTQTQAISGLGGIGKTQVAIEYAYRYRSCYKAVLWARAETRDVFIADFMTIAELLRLPEKDEQDPRHTLAAVKNWLHTSTDWLLILDNVENFSTIEDGIPTGGDGHIILTTRMQATGTLGRRINLEQMQPEEGALFLLRRSQLLASDVSLTEASETMRAAAGTISQLMDGLPLALDQAGAYIEQTSCSLSDYLDRYRTHRNVLLGLRGTISSDHPQSMKATFSLSFAKIELTHPAAADFLRLCSFLHPDTIPEAIFIGAGQDLGPVLGPIAADAVQFDTMIAALRTYSLIHRDAEAKILNVHRLVQAILKDDMDQYACKVWAERVARILNRVFPSADIVETDVTSWPTCQQYLPHVLACVALVEQEVLCIPEAAQLLHHAGIYLFERGLYEEAQPLLQRALAIREQALGADHPDVANSLDKLALLCEAQWKDAQAEQCYQQALDIRIRVLGSKHLDVARSLNNIGFFNFKKGQYAQAESLYRQALAIFEQTLGPDHLDVAQCLHNLAAAQREQGRHAEAEPLHQRVLAIREQALGPNHPQVAASLRSLAITYHTQGKYLLAEPFYQRALAIREQALGPDHPDVAMSLRNLAMLYHQLGKYSQAELFLQRTLRICERAFGPSHPFVADVLVMLAELYLTQRKYAEAEPLLTSALTNWEQTLGPDHPDVAQCLNGLADLYCLQGRYSQAEPLCRRALTIREQTFGSQHTYVAQSWCTLADIYVAQGKCVEAEPLLTSALSVCQQAYGPDHPDIAHCLNKLAELYHMQGKDMQAIPLLQQALIIREKLLGPDHPDVTATRERCAHLLSPPRQESKTT